MNDQNQESDIQKRAGFDPVYAAAFAIFLSAFAYLIYATGWVWFSDEADHKQTLSVGQSYLEGDMFWFYGEEGVDIYLFSEALAELYSGEASPEGEDAQIGAHLHYASDVTDMSPDEFLKTVPKDAAEVAQGNLSGTNGDLEMGVYEVEKGFLFALQDMKTPGVSGYGPLENLMRIALGVVCLASVIINHRSAAAPLLGAFMLVGIANVHLLAEFSQQEPVLVEKLPIELPIGG